MGIDDQFEILPAGELRRRYGLIAENRPTIRLDLSKVPRSLHGLIPLAERFGESDDLIREDIIRSSAAVELQAMKLIVEANNDALDQWLGGPESVGPNYSNEYIALSCLRMAADSC